MTKIVRVREDKYNELCHQVRHLETLAKMVDKRSDRLQSVLIDLTDEVKEQRKTIMERINSLDSMLANVNGNVVDCNECPARGECSYADKHNTSIGTHKA